MTANEDVVLTLAHDDALVLFDLLQRWIDDEGGENLRTHVRHDAELWALNTVSCAREPIMAPLDQNYPNDVPEARSRISERAGQWPRGCGSSRRQSRMR
jgi:hypothetical protein